jgi:hypothetical protein
MEAQEPTRPCPQCGHDWPDTVRHCGECGASMPDATVVASPYQVQVEATQAPGSSTALVRSNPTVPAHASVPVVSVANPQHIVTIPAPTPLFVPPPEPATLETRMDVDVDAVGEAWRLVRARLGMLAVGTVIVSLASSALSSTVVGLLALGPLQGGGFGAVGLRAASGRSVELNDFFAGFTGPVWKKLVLSGLLVGAAVLLGSVLLVLPGLYLAMASAYTPLLVIDRDMDPWKAFKMSMQGVNAQLGRHVAVFVVLALVNAAGALACGVGVLVTLPLAAVTLAVCYGRVFGFAGGVDRLNR